MIQASVGGFGRFILDTAEETGQFTFLVRSTFGWMANARIDAQLTRRSSAEWLTKRKIL